VDLNDRLKVMRLNVETQPHQFRTRNSANEPSRTQSNLSKNAVKSTKAINILPLITVWAQLRVQSDDNEIIGETGTRWAAMDFRPHTPVENSTGKLLSFSFAVVSSHTMSS
jgi:hypothetical protein